MEQENNIIDSEEALTEDTQSNEIEKHDGVLKADLSVENHLDLILTLEEGRKYKVIFPDKWTPKEAIDILQSLAQFFIQKEQEKKDSEEVAKTSEESNS